MICVKCGQRYVADFRVFHDPLKCEDCQPGPGEGGAWLPDIEPEAEVLEETEYDLGGEA